MAKDNVLERLKKLDEERSKLIESAFGEALREAESAVEQLNMLGYNYELVDTTKKTTKKTGGTKREIDPNKICDVCGFATAPKNHDKRSHRGQSEKKPFTSQELKEMGLTKVTASQ